MSRPVVHPPCPCLCCKKEFKPVKAGMKFCSVACSNQHKNNEYRRVIHEMIEAGTAPTSSKEATLRGLYFYVGVPCFRGHVGFRKARDNGCIDCIREKHKREAAERKDQRKPTPVESMQTVSTWLHILPNWTAVVVERV